MHMRKLMIAGGTEEIRQALETLFRDRCVIQTCADGETAIELLGQFAPDILVLDMILPKTDGLSVLQQLRNLELKTMVLAQIGLESPYVMEQLHRLNVDYVMAKPCYMKALEVRITDFLAQLQEAPVQPQNDGQTVANLLIALGFSTKLDGYGYLVDAIPLYAQDPSQAITKELYVTVGQNRNKDGKLVERSIRSAIDKAWQEGNEALWRQYFRCAPDGTVLRPSNGTFIARMAQVLLSRMRQIHFA